MSAETLRKAAEEIRSDKTDERVEPSTEELAWLAVADWLDEEADEAEQPNMFGSAGADFILNGSPALAVARAYLGETP